MGKNGFITREKNIGIILYYNPDHLPISIVMLFQSCYRKIPPFLVRGCAYRFSPLCSDGGRLGFSYTKHSSAIPGSDSPQGCNS